MNHFFCTFTDLRSLKEFISLKPHDDDPDNLEYEDWRHCYRFLKNDTAFQFLDEKITVPQSNETSYSLFRALANRYWQGDESIRFNQNFNELTPKEFIELNNHQKFVIAEKEKLQNIRTENTGFVINDPIDLLNYWKRLSKGSSLSVMKKQGESVRITQWEQIKDYVLPLNSLVICDNYILSNYFDVEYNLFKILSVLLEKKGLEVPLDITILTHSFYAKKRRSSDEKLNETVKKKFKEIPGNEYFKIIPIKDQTPIIEVYNRIHDFLKKTLGNDSFNLSLIQRELPDIHDRYIYSNYFVFYSGNGYNYFDYQGQIKVPSSTIFEIIPRTLDLQKTKIYIDRLAEVKEMIENNPAEKVIGSGKNRLLDI